jgi:hypothetical protein
LATSRPVALPLFRSNFPVESTVNPGEFSWSIGREVPQQQEIA